MKTIEILLLTALAEALTRSEPEPERSFPEPEREPLEENEFYWVPILGNVDSLARPMTWGERKHDYCALEQGLIHLTREAAEAHSRALIALSGGTP